MVSKWTYTWPILDRYLADTWPVLDRCLIDTWPILERYLSDTWAILERYLTDTWPVLDRYLTDTSPAIDRYISADASADGRSIYRSTIGRLSVDYRSTIGRLSVDYRPIAGRLSTGISFCFWATYLGSEKPTSGKNPSSGSVCTVGKLSSVDVHVTSTVLTELGIHGPTSVFKLCRGCRCVTSVWCCYITVLGL